MDNTLSYILLRGGTLLIHDEHDHVIPKKSDLLIQNDRISRIDDDIQPPPGTQIIDCADSLIPTDICGNLNRKVSIVIKYY
jgi:predicted amidohydrolase